MRSVDYPVAINLADLLALCKRHADAIDHLLLGWLEPSAQLVQTEDGPALPLRLAETPIRQRQLSGLIDLLARQIGPGMSTGPVRSYGFVDGRWQGVSVPKQKRLW